MKAIAFLAAAFALFCISAPPCYAGPFDENMCIAQQNSGTTPGQLDPRDLSPPGTVREGERPVMPESRPPAQRTPRELQPRDVSPPGSVLEGEKPVMPESQPQTTPRELQPRDVSPPGSVLE
ncbi:MAG TPA: hypothetical protein PK587_04365, partial [Syntrophales bacterium]|nr:hypothetical protein [Syntrophales bacterium]